jgi:hypothetical protein
VIGSSTFCMPKGRSASSTALAIAAGGANDPPVSVERTRLSATDRSSGDREAPRQSLQVLHGFGKLDHVAILGIDVKQVRNVR